MTLMASARAFASLLLVSVCALWAQENVVAAVPQVTTLHAFTGGADGNTPTVRLVADAKGKLYAPTTNGGTNSVGSILQVTPPKTVGGTWGYSVIYSFGALPDGQIPQS